MTVKAAVAIVGLLAASLGAWHFMRMGLDALHLGSAPLAGTPSDASSVATAYAGQLTCLAIGLLCLRVLKTLPKENAP